MTYPAFNQKYQDFRVFDCEDFPLFNNEDCSQFEDDDCLPPLMCYDSVSFCALTHLTSSLVNLYIVFVLPLVFDSSFCILPYYSISSYDQD